MTTLKIVSLFCGAGGSDLGAEGGFDYDGKHYERLNTDLWAAFERDKRAHATHTRNLHGSYSPGGIAELLEVEEAITKDRIPAHDILIGGPPCQSFSDANMAKQLDDPRSVLYRQMIEVVNKFQPKAFILENVKSLIYVHEGKVWQQFLWDWQQTGYILSYIVLNAADYGIPQKRERFFMVGIRKDLGFAYKFPPATHCKPGPSKNVMGLPLWRTIADFLQPDAEIEDKYWYSDKAIAGALERSRKMQVKDFQAVVESDKTAPTITTKQFDVGRNPAVRSSVSPKEPTPTITGSQESLSLDPTLQPAGQFRYRRFTPLECKRLQSFPESFTFLGSNTSQYQQIGNAMPPVLVHHIVKALVEQLERGK